MQIISTVVMSIMRHCMQILRADQMLFQQHGLKSQLKNSYTRGIVFPRQDLQKQPVAAAGRKSLCLGEAGIGFKGEPLIREPEQPWEAKSCTF